MTIRIFCIDGVIVESEHEVTKEDLDSQVIMPIEDQPIMAGVLSGKDVPLLTPQMSHQFIDQFGGRMVEDINSETFPAVGEALVGDSTEWPA